MSSTTLQRPPNAGTGKIAIASTRLAYANLRTGPGMDHEDIGDMRDFSLVVYFPNSRTEDNWVWVEYDGLMGWVLGDVVNFVDSVMENPPVYTTPTPYDGKVAIWHWKGQGIPQTTIDRFAKAIKQLAPNVTQVFVKTSDGANWQGDFDDSRLAIRGLSTIDKWVHILEQNGLEFHAWCVLRGQDIDSEAEIVSAACNRPGVRSMILDVEPYAGFWDGGKEAIRPLMLKIRRSIGSEFHLGLGVDPRKSHYSSIFPDEWFPFVDSVHPMCYWNTFRRTPREVLEETYQVWGDFGRPLIPILQGNAPVSEQRNAHTLATQKYGAKAVSWWRYGVIAQWRIVNKSVQLKTSPSEPTVEPTDNYTDEMVITPSDTSFRSGSYTGLKEFKQFKSNWDWQVLYKETNPFVSEVWAEWDPNLPQEGRYEISVFVPARHATTRKARYKIHGTIGSDAEVIIEIDQSKYRNQWVSIGTFEIDSNMANAGKVLLNDLTGERDREIAFDAVRWRRIVAVPPGSSPSRRDGQRPSIINGAYVADGFDSPVGSVDKRSGGKVWPRGWRDAAPFAELYRVGTDFVAYHTGADLNWGSSAGADYGLPVYACANGIVTFAGRLPGTWGDVIVVRHDPLYDPQGDVLYSRYAHVSEIHVHVGQRVSRGEQIASIGSADGRFSPHLHFDLSPTTILEQRPSDWPRLNQDHLLKNYVDPKDFIKKHRP